MHDTNNHPPIFIIGLNPTIDQVVSVDQFKPHTHARAKELARFPAGKGVNVARVLSTINHQSTLLGFAGFPELTWFENYLAQHPTHPAAAMLTPFAGHTRHALTIIDQSGKPDTHIVTENPPVSDEQVNQLTNNLKNALHATNTTPYVCFSGRMLPGMTIKHFDTLLQIATSANANIAIDASGDLLKHALNYPLWLLKPNQAELAELTTQPLNSQNDILNAMAALPQTIQNIVTTLGPEGALGLSQNHAYHVKLSQPANIISTVGCGDSFYAGFISAWIKTPNSQDQFLNALTSGIATATANATSPQIAAFTPEQVTKFRNPIITTTLDLPDSRA